MSIVEMEKVVIRVNAEECEILKVYLGDSSSAVMVHRTSPKVSGSFALKKDEDGYYLEFCFEK